MVGGGTSSSSSSGNSVGVFLAGDGSEEEVVVGSTFKNLFLDLTRLNIVE